MKKQLIVLLGGVLLLCVAKAKNVDVVKYIICSVEALADGGDIGTPDFYLSKTHTERFSVTVKECQQKGLTNIPDDIRYTDLGGYPCVFYFCCDENESDSSAGSCHPYQFNTPPQLNRENLCDIFTSGIWSYENNNRR